MKEPHDILIRPVITEKGIRLRETFNQYCFEVDRNANKIEIRQAVEEVFDIKDKVLKVRTVSMSGKWKRRGRRGGGYQPDWKKAVVSVVKGVEIKIFEES
ncbi:MAG: 50S ribosomal protein L23 [Deltaproteobacteria bacterium]|jgi:large subunit ribosomal protein L23|nr:50S ribosomal protein L23 [Deltaproteobacteria bacterium]